MRLPRSTWLVLTTLLALAFGVACVLPNILQRYDNRYPYQGIEMMAPDQEYHYASRMREIVDGHWGAGNVYHSGNKDQPALQPALPEWVIAMATLLTGVEPISMFVWSKVFFGALLFLVMVGFVYSLTGRKWVALTATACLLFATSLFTGPWDIFKFLSAEHFTLEALRFSRGINPQWSSLWFFVALWGLAQWCKVPRVKPLLIALFATVILVYSYFYAWSYIAVACAFMLAWYMWKRDKGRILHLLIFAGAVAAFSVPYILHLLELMHHPYYAATAAQQGVAMKREVVLGVSVFVLIGLGLFSKKMFPSTWPLLPALGLGGLVVLNQQLITGAFLVPHHYHWYFIHPLMTLLLVAFAAAYAAHMKVPSTLRFAFGSLSILVALYLGFAQQTWAFEARQKEWGPMQPYKPVFDALNELTDKDEVVLASSKQPLLQDLIPIYTDLNVYEAGNANLQLTSPEQIRAAAFFDLWLQGLNPEDAATRFPTDLRASISARLYGIHFREQLGRYEDIPDNLVQEAVKQYQDFVALSLDKKLALEPVDYLLRAPQDTQSTGWRQIEIRAKVIWTGNGFTLYALRP